MALGAVRSASRAWRQTTLFALVITIMAAYAFRQAWGTPVYGALERVVLGVPILWMTAVAAKALKATARRRDGVVLTRG